MKIAILYYTFSGNTKYVAEILAKELKADLIEMKRKKEFKSKGFLLFFLGGFQAMTHQKSELEPFKKDLQSYDLLILGTPVWAWTVHPAVRGLYAQEKFSGKKIAIFCCCDVKKNVLKVAAKTGKFLRNNEILGEMEFINPLTYQSSEQTKIAKDWAKEIIKKAKK